jgi:hypothetical protein
MNQYSTQPPEGNIQGTHAANKQLYASFQGHPLSR